MNWKKDFHIYNSCVSEPAYSNDLQSAMYY